MPRLPWWKRRLYVEGLLWEFSNQEEPDYVDATPDGLASMGFSVGSVGGN